MWIVLTCKIPASHWTLCVKALSSLIFNATFDTCHYLRKILRKIHLEKVSKNKICMKMTWGRWGNKGRGLCFFQAPVSDYCLNNILSGTQIIFAKQLKKSDLIFFKDKAFLPIAKLIKHGFPLLLLWIKKQVLFWRSERYHLQLKR